MNMSEEIFWNQINRVCETRSGIFDYPFENSMEALIMLLHKDIREKLKKDIEKARIDISRDGYQNLFCKIMDWYRQGEILL